DRRGRQQRARPQPGQQPSGHAQLLDDAAPPRIRHVAKLSQGPLRRRSMLGVQRTVRLPLLAALFALAPASALAYVRAVTPTGAPWHWDRPVFTLEVHAGQPGPTLTSRELVEAVAGAAAPWS